ncbi:MAG: hypothetical protein AAGA86_12750 [Bacteroidota bacterium]
MFKGRSITLKHLLIDGNKHIGLQFKSDKVVQALVEKLPKVKWSEEFAMYHIENNKTNLGVIFNKFRGEAWINGNYFFESKSELNTEKPKNISWYRNRSLDKNVKRCPTEYLDKLEIKKIFREHRKDLCAPLRTLHQPFQKYRAEGYYRA